MQVLITRPEPRATLLAQKISVLGINAKIFPAIVIMDLPLNEQVITILADLSQVNGIIFISPTAVEKFAQKINILPTTMQLFAVGEGTAQTLAQYGWHQVIFPIDQFNSEALLKVAELQHITKKCFLICQGVGGNPLLTETLTARGAKVIPILLYQRVLPQAAHLPDLHAIDVIICTSAESMKNLYQLFGNAILKKRLLVSSVALQLAAAKIGFALTPYIAENATDEAIIDALQKINNNRQ